MRNLDLTTDEITDLEESLEDDFPVCDREGCFFPATWRSWHLPGYSCPVYSCDRCKTHFDKTNEAMGNKVTWVCPKCRRDPLLVTDIMWRRL